MFLEPGESFARATALWNGKPSGGLMWTTYLDEPLRRWTEQAGYADSADFLERDLGTMQYAEFVRVADFREPQVEIIKRTENEVTTLEHKSPWGALTEVMRADRCLKHRVASADDLKIQIKMWENTDVVRVADRFEKTMAKWRGRAPVVIVNGSSAVQEMIQFVMSVEDFWFAVSDCTALMEQAFKTWEALQAKAYAISTTFPADNFYEDENTSTTLISPVYYRKYSLGHIRAYSDAVHKTGKRFVVHMCGHLRGLMTTFPETRMDGIDCLTPPSVGNCEFDYAYRVMPRDFFCTGRFGTSLWYNKTRDEIMANLAAVLPHEIYRNHAFVLAVTGDGIKDIPLDNIRLLRDCINDYEKQGGQ